MEYEVSDLVQFGSNMNLVQLELFGRPTDEAGELPIKQGVVRFYDPDDAITEAVVAAVIAEERYNDYLVETKASGLTSRWGWLRTWWTNRTARRLFQKSIEMREDACTTAIDTFREMAHLSDKVAIERPDYRFRMPANEAEVLDLANRALQSTTAWVFVFRHNHLLANPLVGIAHLN